MNRAFRIRTARTTFLLGSGISIPSGYPCTAQITDALLSKNWLEHRDQAGSDVPLSRGGFSGTYSFSIEATIALVRVLKSHIDQHLALHAKGASSYEDIYYMARQLLDALRGEYDNPGLLPMLFDLRTKTSLLVENLNVVYRLDGLFRDREELGLEYLLERALLFIEEAVVAALEPRPVEVGLDMGDEWLSRARSLRIVSLNHDLLLDQHFTKYGICDGFVPFSEGSHRFDPETFDRDTASRVQLLKLHGSINWYRFKPDRDEIALKVTSANPLHLKGKDGEDLLPPTGRLLLAGTTNKEISYGSGIFLDLMFQFWKCLVQTDMLVVSGYGFGDKGINNRLWAWMASSPEKKMVILHERPEALLTSAKPSFAINQKRYREEQRLFLVTKWMRDCSLADIEREMHIASRRPR